MTRVFRQRLPWLLLVAVALLGSATLRVAHVHEPQDAERHAVVQCDICQSLSAGAGAPVGFSPPWRALQPIDAAIDLPAPVLQPEPAPGAHRPRGPPA